MFETSHTLGRGAPISPKQDGLFIRAENTSTKHKFSEDFATAHHLQIKSFRKVSHDLEGYKRQPKVSSVPVD